MRGRLLAAILLLAVSAPSFAESPTATLDRFHKSLREKDAKEALDVLATEAVIYEQGFAEASRKEWARKQLGSALMFASDSERRILSRESGQSGDAAWVLTTTLTTVNVSDTQKLRLDGSETAILRRDKKKGSWKIVHLHWSAHEAPAPGAAAP